VYQADDGMQGHQYRMIYLAVAMKLFEAFKRTYHDYSSHSESTYNFLNRSASPAVALIRDELERWFQSYPNEHKKEMQAKLIDNFEPAFFELLLFQVFNSISNKIEIHPYLNEKSGDRPDFMISLLGNTNAIIEATTFSDGSNEKKAQRSLLNRLYDEINEIRCPDYFLGLDIISEPAGMQPSSNKIKRKINEELKKLDVDELEERANNYGWFHSINYIQDEFNLEITFIPKPSQYRGDLTTKPIGAYPSGDAFWFGGYISKLRRGILKKAQKYKGVDLPFIISVNVLDGYGLSDQDIFHLLFGTMEATLPNINNSNTDQRINEGLWFTSKGMRYRRISGILLTHVFPWNIPKAKVNLYNNPYALHPIPEALNIFPCNTFSENGMMFKEGQSFGDILKLPDDWPGELFND